MNRKCSCGHCGTCLIEEIRELRYEVLFKMAALDDAITALTAKVASNTTVLESAITLINGIQAQITTAVKAALAAGATPAELQAITDLGTSLDNEDTKLAAAITANTPTAPNS